MVKLSLAPCCFVYVLSDSETSKYFQADRQLSSHNNLSCPSAAVFLLEVALMLAPDRHERGRHE